MSSGLPCVYKGATLSISFTRYGKGLSISAVRAEEQVLFSFLMISVLILLRPSDAFLHICLYNFELVKEFGQKMLTAGNEKFLQKNLTLMK